MPKKRANGEGSIRKRKDGRWEGRYTAGCDPTTGKPIHKSVLAKTQSEAKEKLKQAIAEAEKLDMSRAKSYISAAGRGEVLAVNWGSNPQPSTRVN